MLNSKIINWYEFNKRDLPWRNTSDPYKIWISEIMLQQTQVVTVVDYYYRFINSFPTIKALALADEQEVLNHWQGLGYYSRARNLHQAVKFIVDNYNGVFPDSFDEIIKLSYVIIKGCFLYSPPDLALKSMVFGVNLSLNSSNSLYHEI